MLKTSCPQVNDVPYTPSKKSSIRLVGLVVIVILLLLASAKWISAPALPEPTVVPVPTYTNTPEPTVTPQPTQTPTPDLDAIYDRQLHLWLVDVVAWVEDFKYEFLVPSTDRDAAFSALEQRAVALLTTLRTIEPSPIHVETHKHLIDSMQSCVDAMGYYRQGDFSNGETYGATCTIGLSLIIDVLYRD